VTSGGIIFTDFSENQLTALCQEYGLIWGPSHNLRRQLNLGPSYDLGGGLLDVINVCNVYQKFLINAFVVFVNV